MLNNDSQLSGGEIQMKKKESKNNANKMMLNAVRWDENKRKGNHLPPGKSQKEESNQIRAARKKKSERIKGAFEKEWKEVKVG